MKVNYRLYNNRLFNTSESIQSSQLCHNLLKIKILCVSISHLRLCATCEMLPSYFILNFSCLGTLSISVGPDSIPDTVKSEFFEQIGTGTALFHSTSVLPSHYHSTGIPFSQFINLH